MESEIQIFREHHRCREPKPSGKVNVFGGMECLTCGFEVVVAPWFSGPAKAVSSPAEPSFDVEGYRAFLRTKLAPRASVGLDVPLSELHPGLMRFQAATVRWALRKGRAALFLSTGLGKTYCELAFGYHVGGQVLLFAPLAVGAQMVRMAEQWPFRGRVTQIKEPSEIDGDGIWITNYQRAERFAVIAERLNGLICDECFTGDQLIDTPYGQKRIEGLRVGDKVYNALGVGLVTELKKREKSRLVHLCLSDGRSFLCSENHPFFSLRGLVSASKLKHGDYLYGRKEVLQAMRSKFPEQKTDSLQSMSQTAQDLRMVQATEADWRSRAFLRTLVLSEMADEPTEAQSQSTYSGNPCANQREGSSMVAFRQSGSSSPAREDREAQSYATTGDSSEGVGNSSPHAASSDDSGRQWPEDSSSAIDFMGPTRRGLVSRIRDFARETNCRISDLLQSGHWKSVLDDSGRGRRLGPFSRGQENAGWEEGSEASGAWVEFVSIYESDDSEFRAISGGRDTVTLYDIEVSGHPSFYADGILVHNSSCLKDETAVTRKLLTEGFADVRFKLAASATPAPNDVTELCNHAEFLGVMKRQEVLATFFTHREDGWYIRRHAIQPFYRWLASWALVATKPGDLGFEHEDARFELPPLEIKESIVKTQWRAEGELFPSFGLRGVGDRASVRRASIPDRIERAVEIIQDSWGKKANH